MKVTLRDGDSIIPWNEAMHLAARRLQGPGAVVGFERTSGVSQVVYVLEPPGRYALEMENVPGYSMSAPIEVDVAAGTTVDVTLPLVRRRE